MACRPWGRLLVRLDWPRATMPAGLAVWETSSWRSVSGAAGLFDQIEDALRTAAAWGAPGLAVTGLPVELRLTEESSSRLKARFPVVTIASRIDPLEFLARQCGGALALPTADLPQLEHRAR